MTTIGIGNVIKKLAKMDKRQKRVDAILASKSDKQAGRFRSLFRKVVNPELLERYVQGQVNDLTELQSDLEDLRTYAEKQYQARRMDALKADQEASRLNRMQSDLERTVEAQRDRLLTEKEFFNRYSVPDVENDPELNDRYSKAQVLKDEYKVNERELARVRESYLPASDDAKKLASAKEISFEYVEFLKDATARNAKIIESIQIRREAFAGMSELDMVTQAMQGNKSDGAGIRQIIQELVGGFGHLLKRSNGKDVPFSFDTDGSLDTYMDKYRALAESNAGVIDAQLDMDDRNAGDELFRL